MFTHIHTFLPSESFAIPLRNTEWCHILWRLMNPWKFIKPFTVMKIISWQCTWQKRLSIIQRCGMIHLDISHLVFGIKRMDPSSVIRAQVSGVVCVCVCVSGCVSRKFIMRIKKASLIWLQAKLTLERRCVCVCVCVCVWERGEHFTYSLLHDGTHVPTFVFLSHTKMCTMVLQWHW